MSNSAQVSPVSSLAVVVGLLWAWQAAGQEVQRPPNAAEPVTAPDSLPFRAGQWGAEFLINDGTAGVGVLYFRTPRRAWLFDASFTASWYDEESSFSPDETGGSVFLRVRAGPRRYRPIGNGAAAYFGFGVTAGLGWRGEGEHDLRTRSWDAGLFGEVGGVYFVTRRLSLGAQGGLYTTYADLYFRASNPPIVSRDRTLNLQLRPVRVVGGLYF